MISNNYGLEEIEIPNAIIKFFKLIVNNRCFYTEWEKDIEEDGNYEEELEKIATIINRLARMERVTSNQFKELKRDNKDPYKDYEIRTKKIESLSF